MIEFCFFLSKIMTIYLFNGIGLPVLNDSLVTKPMCTDAPVLCALSIDLMVLPSPATPSSLPNIKRGAGSKHVCLGLLPFRELGFCL